jgi:hypothetical protein
MGGATGIKGPDAGTNDVANGGMKAPDIIGCVIEMGFIYAGGAKVPVAGMRAADATLPPAAAAVPLTTPRAEERLARVLLLPSFLRPKGFLLY